MSRKGDTGIPEEATLEVGHVGQQTASKGKALYPRAVEGPGRLFIRKVLTYSGEGLSS